MIRPLRFVCKRTRLKGAPWLAIFIAAQCAAVPGAQAAGFPLLRDLLSTHKITSPDDLVRLLPVPLRTYYTLVFQSRSLQGASYANPRVILFGNDATLVVTFNGDATERGYDAIETMDFDAVTSTFRFREIQFNGAAAPPTVSEVNPPLCTACHGTPARPIWDTPPSWPGAYGERYLRGLSTQEAKGIRAFLTLQPTHPRYGALIAAGRFAERDTYVTSSRAAYNGVTTEPPNARLSTLLMQLNARAIMARLVSRPNYATHRYALLAAAEGNCGPLEHFYPAALRAPLALRLREFLASHTQVDSQQEAAKLRRLGRTGRSVTRTIRPVDMGQLRFVVERGLGANTDSWTLALESNTFDLAAPDDTWSIREALFQEVAGADSELADARQYRTFTADDAYCTLLATRSNQALNQWYTSQPSALSASSRSVDAAVDMAAVDSGAPPAIGVCATCHTGEIAPQIPFGSPAELVLRLREGNYPRGHLLDEVLYRLSDAAGTDRMPRGMLLPTEQVQELRSYFMGLGNASRN